MGVVLGSGRPDVAQRSPTFATRILEDRATDSTRRVTTELVSVRRPSISALRAHILEDRAADRTCRIAATTRFEARVSGRPPGSLSDDCVSGRISS